MVAAMTAPPTTVPEQPRPLWVYEAFRAVAGHIRSIALVTLVSALAAGAWAALQPKLYEARATLEYDAGLGHTRAAATQGEPSYLEARELIKTQTYIMKSRSLAEQVVRKLGLDKATSDGKKSNTAPSPSSFERAVETVQNAIEIVPVQGTRVVEIRVRAGTPDLAASIANALVDVYLEKSLEDRVGASSRALEWLRQQQAEMKQEVNESELAVFKFREEHHSLSTSLDERRKLITAQVQAYSGALTELRIKRVQAQARVNVLKETIAAEPDPMAVQAGPIAADPAVVDLRKRYRDADARLQQLAVTQGPETHQWLVAKAELDATRAQLLRQIDTILRGAQADLKEIERSETGLQQAMTQTQQQSLELSREEMEFASLERDRASRAERYSVVLERTAQADLERALGASTARVVDRAGAVRTTVGPPVGTAAGWGALVGLALGILGVLGVSGGFGGGRGGTLLAF